MTLDEYLGIGVTIELGSHTFDADEIRCFAAKYDPQPFHLDEEAARQSVFGKLCASGWHTGAMWMRYNVATHYEKNSHDWTGPGPCPTFGPSPGIRELKWLKPVFIGETITYFRTGLGHRAHPRRPGWRIMSVKAEAFDSTGDKVIEFKSGVMVNTGEAAS